MEFKHISENKVNDVCVVKFVSDRLPSDYPLNDLENEINYILDEQKEKKLLFDCTTTQYLCSAMLCRLIKFQRRAIQLDVQLKITIQNPDLKKVVSILKLNELIKIYGSIEEAMVAFTD